MKRPKSTISQYHYMDDVAGGFGILNLPVLVPMDGYLTWISLTALCKHSTADVSDYGMCWLSGAPIYNMYPVGNAMVPQPVYLTLEIASSFSAPLSNAGFSFNAPRADRALNLRVTRGQTLYFGCNSFISVTSTTSFRALLGYESD